MDNSFRSMSKKVHDRRVRSLSDQSSRNTLLATIVIWLSRSGRTGIIWLSLFFFKAGKGKPSCPAAVFSSPERKYPQRVPHTITNPLIWLCEQESTYVQITLSLPKDTRACVWSLGWFYLETVANHGIRTRSFDLRTHSPYFEEC